MVREQFPWVRLIENPNNVGFARANNQGINASSGRYVLLLNSDTIVHFDAIQILVRFLEQRPLAGAAGARLLNNDGTLQQACHSMLTPERELLRLTFLDSLSPSTYSMQGWDKTTPRQVEVIKGACLMLRRQALDQIGLMDESYFMYTEEVDLCYRMAQAGWELWYVPTAVVTHYGGASSQQMPEEMYLQLYRSKLQFYRKFGGEARANRFKTYLRLLYWPRAIVASALALWLPSWTARSHLYRKLLNQLDTY